MSARTIGGSGSINHHQHVTVEARDERLSLSANSVIIHKNGIEFRSAKPFTPWNEMTLTIQSPAEGSRVHCNGVVISCTGNKHTGYHISVVFTGLSRQAQARITAWAHLR